MLCVIRDDAFSVLNARTPTRSQQSPQVLSHNAESSTTPGPQALEPGHSQRINRFGVG
jgi:hypothetical protein